jgi:hypothetical protein
MPLLLGALVRTHFDLFPVVLLLAGLLLLCRDRPRAGLAVLGLGAMTKAFPLVAVPVALVWLVAGGRRREAGQGALACAAVMVAIAGAAVAVSPDGAADALRYQLDRPVQIESSPALVLLGLDFVGAGEAQIVSSYRSVGLLHPADGAITWLCLTAFVALVALLCALVAAGNRGGGVVAVRGLGAAAETGPTGARGLVIAALAATVGFAVFGKVLSPQFVLWAIPLGALAFAWRLRALAAAVALAAVLTQIEFPAHYLDVVYRDPLAVALVGIRNLTLCAVIGLAVWELRPRGHGGGAPVSGLYPRRQQQLLDPGRTAVRARLD